jgi:cytochrome b561
LLFWHKSLGITVLLLALARLAWKLVNRPYPAPLEVVWQRKAAAAGHGLLYLLILLQPITGWIMASAAGSPVSLFGWVSFPPLVGKDHDLHETFEEVHEIAFYVLLVAAVVHIAAALYHHFVLKDNVLRRMLPFARVGHP